MRKYEDEMGVVVDALRTANLMIASADQRMPLTSWGPTVQAADNDGVSYGSTGLAFGGAQHCAWTIKSEVLQWATSISSSAVRSRGWPCRQKWLFSLPWVLSARRLSLWRRTRWDPTKERRDEMTKLEHTFDLSDAIRMDIIRQNKNRTEAIIMIFKQLKRIDELDEAQVESLASLETNSRLMRTLAKAEGEA